MQDSKGEWREVVEQRPDGSKVLAGGEVVPAVDERPVVAVGDALKYEADGATFFALVVSFERRRLTLSTSQAPAGHPFRIGGPAKVWFSAERSFAARVIERKKDRVVVLVATHAARKTPAAEYYEAKGRRR